MIKNKQPPIIIKNRTHPESNPFSFYRLHKVTERCIDQIHWGMQGSLE